MHLYKLSKSQISKGGNYIYLKFVSHRRCLEGYQWQDTSHREPVLHYSVNPMDASNGSDVISFLKKYENMQTSLFVFTFPILVQIATNGVMGL